MIQPLKFQQYKEKAINPLIDDVVDEFVNQINHFIAIKNFVDETDEWFKINLYVVCNRLQYGWEIIDDNLLNLIEERFRKSGWNLTGGNFYFSGPYKGIKFYK